MQPPRGTASCSLGLSISTVRPAGKQHTRAAPLLLAGVLGNPMAPGCRPRPRGTAVAGAPRGPAALWWHGAGRQAPALPSRETLGSRPVTPRGAFLNGRACYGGGREPIPPHRIHTAPHHPSSTGCPPNFGPHVGIPPRAPSSDCCLQPTYGSISTNVSPVSRDSSRPRA